MPAHRSIQQLAADARALKLLDELEAQASVPPERGGARLTDWERDFLASLRKHFDRLLTFTVGQREKLDEIHSDIEKGRSAPWERDAGAANLFSAMSPERQAAERRKAAKIRLPWE
jgi:hypothetical protein